MSQKIIELDDIGPVILSKRRGAKNLRLTILPDGRVRVSMPVWVPYATGINFAKTRKDWIARHTNASSLLLLDGQRIGKSYRLQFKPGSSGIQARLGINSITITSVLAPTHHEVQAKAKSAAERALKKEAQHLLSSRLRQLAESKGFKYKGFRVKKLTSRWGSCSSAGDITLNYFLIQLPWRLIDYVILHELAHTIHHDHSPKFWKLVENNLPDYKSLRRELKTYRPIILGI